MTPAELGFRMPAEWEPHAATWLTWPRREGISFPGIFDKIPPVIAAMVHAISTHEPVHINVWDEAMENEAKEALNAHDALNTQIHFHHFPAYEPWVRDHGPVFVVGQNERAVVDWEYNAWGSKYPPFELDNSIPEQVAKHRGLRRFKPKMILEGGSIEVNGHGTLLTTESCLLNPNRNPELNREQIEQRLRDFLGVQNILWLAGGISGDDTDGHIDDLTRFVNPTTVVTVVENNLNDANNAILLENLTRLRSMYTEDGQPLEIIELPMPAPVIRENERLPASYANFYITNGSVLVPVFDDPNDAEATEILASLFPTRETVGINSCDLAWGLGSFHCLTQQEPAPPTKTREAH